MVRFAVVGVMLLGCFRLFGSPNGADEFLLDVWTGDNGLPNSSVTEIAQTPELKHARIAGLFLDAKNKLWINTDDGSLTSWRNGRSTHEWQGWAGLRMAQVFSRSNDIAFATLGGDLVLRRSGAGSTNVWQTLSPAAVPMFFHAKPEVAIRMAGDSSRTTHGAPECVDASRLLAAVLLLALAGSDKETILIGHGASNRASDSLSQIAAGAYREKPKSAIRGSGYVVECLEAALWCFHKTDSYETAVLEAVNLGDDTDTTAAVCGQIAGAFYGESGIPKRWRDQVAKAKEIGKLADHLRGGHAIA